MGFIGLILVCYPYVRGTDLPLYLLVFVDLCVTHMYVGQTKYYQHRLAAFLCYPYVRGTDRDDTVMRTSGTVLPICTWDRPLDIPSFIAA